MHAQSGLSNRFRLSVSPIILKQPTQYTHDMNGVFVCMIEVPAIPFAKWLSDSEHLYFMTTQ